MSPKVIFLQAIDLKDFRKLRGGTDIYIYEYWQNSSKNAEIGWLVGFYCILNLVSYVIPNPCLYKQSLLFETIQFCVINSLIVKNISI